MTKANTQVIAKAAAIVAGAGLVLSSFAIALPAGAQTTTTTTTTTSSAMFTRDLTIGSTGADVTALQNWLISKGFSIPAGATGYFGTQTQAAVAAYQAANGITPAAGYFGPITRAKVNAGGSVNVPGGDDDDDDDDDDNGPSNGETSIEDFEVNDADDNDLEEGASEAEVAEIQFDVEDADAELERADLIFRAAGGNDEDRPWNVFDTIYLMNDGDTIAEMDSDSKADWDETDTDDVYRIRLNGIGEMFDEGSNVTLDVAADIASSIDGTNNGEDWTVEVATNPGDSDGFRFTDSEDVQTEEGDTDVADFSIGEEGEDNDYSLKASSDDPAATTIEVEDDDSSDEQTVFVFTFEADEDSDEALEVEDFDITLEVTNPTGGDNSVTIDQVVDEVTVMIDGEEYDADAASTDTDDVMADAGSDTAAYAVDLEEDDFVVDSGDSVDVEVMVSFHALDGSASSYDSGTLVQASVDSSTFEVVGDDSDEEVDDPSDSEEGEEHTLAVDGLSASGVSDDAERTFVADDAGEFDQGTFTIVYELTAFGEDIFVDKSDPVEDNDGTYTSTQTSYSVTNPTNNSSIGTLSATGGDFDELSNSWRINEGDTAEFTLEVTVTASADSSAAVTLEAIGYALSNINGNLQYIVPDEPEFETNSITLLAT